MHLQIAAAHVLSLTVPIRMFHTCTLPLLSDVSDLF